MEKYDSLYTKAETNDLSEEEQTTMKAIHVEMLSLA
jgi:hypothetical protein